MNVEVVPIDQCKDKRESYLRWFGNVQRRETNELIIKKDWVDSSWENEKE